jgi:hypothetical protein
VIQIYMYVQVGMYVRKMCTRTVQTVHVCTYMYSESERNDDP